MSAVHTLKPMRHTPPWHEPYEKICSGVDSATDGDAPSACSGHKQQSSTGQKEGKPWVLR